LIRVGELLLFLSAGLAVKRRTKNADQRRVDGGC
jgi:hypothetical protein